MKRLAFLLCWIASAALADDRVSLVLSDVRLVDLVRVTFGELSKEPYILSHEVLESQDLFTVDLRYVSADRVVSSIADLVQSAGFEVRKRGGVVWIGKAQEQADELIVYRPRHRSARYLADVVQSVTAAKSVLSRSIKPMEQIGQGVQPVPVQQAQAMKQSSPTSVEGQIDRSEVDQIAFNVAPKYAAKVRKLLADLDTPSGEVVLKAAVYEVGLTKSEGSAVQLAIKVAGVSASLSGNVLSGGSIKFAQGGIEAVLSALDADVRFKSVSRPQVRVRNGAQARFSVGQDVPVLGSSQMDKNGNPVQSVDYKQSGVILTATPEIRSDVIELALQQELSNFVVTKTGVNGSPTLIKRAVNTKLGLVPGEVVMLAGLQDDQEDETQNRFPFFGWLMSQERQNRRSEILVFIEVVRI
ncbi:MAG: type II secretory pathway component PulD [Rhodocyclaceae bacterium]|nr:MAG: type II secretory pathway component PulD [Rhodocyclaceae bacterium]TND01879.1 MAG: type II secretory pathway, component PulD [Rhodocyclaceae bacterium]